ncbi:GAK system ATP-grasp enzyme [Nitrincola nitratireducens]|uniref:Ribosomal protein S6 modification protein n=1 Tax=Nitrincola nitratireducens TaxID=1229521 RepID=W9UYK8_9GAMM|nr:GAK system ATP-grasp enzyme [Nitrincola nitratireducens]EXJ09801.1 ribosomal protein S6 modification protein [Nitrincola nitratireducens]
MSSLKIGVVGIPGKWSTEVLANEIEKRTGFRLVIELAKLELNLTQGCVTFAGHNLCELDGIIIKKIGSDFGHVSIERLELLRVAEACGVRVFSNANSLIRLLDRLTCSVTLRNHQIPMPQTLITESVDSALTKILEWNSVVIKPLFSTKARGMQILCAQQSKDELILELNRYKARHPILYVQKKIELGGQDMALIFLKGQFIGAYARVAAQHTWNTTIHSGGHYAPYTPDNQTLSIAERAQSAFNLDFATVDIAMTPEGPVVFEVSTLGGFKGAKMGCGIDVASIYADYAIQELSA